MKVCLLNAPWQEGGRWGIRAGCRMPNLMRRRHNSYVPFPFLMAYAAACVESHGFDVLCIDGVAERCSMASVMRRVGGYSPDLLVAETSTPSFTYDVGVLEQVRAEVPTAQTALYGPHVSALPHEGLQPAAVDFVIVGEPEHTLLELTQALADGGDVASIPGLGYTDAAGEARVNPRRPLIADLDAMPFPRRVGLPMDRYACPGFPAPVVFIYGSRGCPYRCNFCLWPQTVFERGNYRMRRPERIVDEMEHVLEELPKTRSFFFDEETFNLRRDRLVRFAEEMKRRQLRVPWGMNARADGWDRELLQSLMETGLFTLRIGIESGDQEVVDRCGKRIDLNDAREMLQMSEALGIRNHVFFMVGLPGESWESVEKTVQYARTLPADSVQFALTVPFPGTDYFHYAEEQGLLTTRDWRRYNSWDSAVMRTPTMAPDEIERALAHARRRVYFSPRFIKRRLAYIRDPRDLWALVRKAARLVVPGN